MLCKKIWLGFAAASLCCMSCSKVNQSGGEHGSECPGGSVHFIRDPLLDRKPEAHSIIQLIAYPERFQHSRVAADGYLIRNEIPSDNVHGELHLTKEGALAHLTNYVNVYFGPCAHTTTTEKMVALQDVLSEFGGLVTVYGEFEAGLDIKRSADFGTICNITRIVSARRSLRLRPATEDGGSNITSPSNR